MNAEQIRKALNEFQDGVANMANGKPEVVFNMTPQIQANATVKLAACAFEIAAQLAELNDGIAELTNGLANIAQPLAHPHP